MTEHAWRLALLERLLMQHLGSPPDEGCLLELDGRPLRYPPSFWNSVSIFLADRRAEDADHVHALYDTVIEFVQRATSPAPH